MNSGEGDYKSGDSDSSFYLKVMNPPDENKEELQMLASLRREQEEDDYGALNLGGPVVRPWDINTSFEESLWNPSSTVCMPSTPRLCFNVILQRIQSVQPLYYLPSLAGCVFPALPWNSFSWPLWILSSADFHFSLSAQASRALMHVTLLHVLPHNKRPWG